MPVLPSVTVSAALNFRGKLDGVQLNASAKRRLLQELSPLHDAAPISFPRSVYAFWTYAVTRRLSCPHALSQPQTQKFKGIVASTHNPPVAGNHLHSRASRDSLGSVTAVTS